MRILHRNVANFVVGQRQKVQGEAAAADGLQQTFAAAGRQNKVGVRRDFLKCLEEGVRSGIIHAIRFRDNNRANAVALEGESRRHVAYKVHRYTRSGAEHVDAVRVLHNFFDVGLLVILDCLRGAPRRHVGCAPGRGFLGFHGNDPAIGIARIGRHLATEAMPTRPGFPSAALQCLRDFHRERLLAYAYRPIDKNRLREPVFTERSHKTDALPVLR